MQGYRRIAYNHAQVPTDPLNSHVVTLYMRDVIQNNIGSDYCYDIHSDIQQVEELSK